MTPDRRAPRVTSGFTLVELLVVLAIIAVGGVVATVATRAPARAQPSRDVYARIAAQRRLAVERGVAVTATIADSAGRRAVTALPDGSVIADDALAIDRRTGRRIDAAH